MFYCFYRFRMMTTKDYSYNGKLWRPCATVADENSFFHSAFGIRAAEGEAYSDKHYKVRRMRWAAFLTYFENEEIPVVLADILIGCFSAKDAYKHKSIRDKNHFESYVRDITMAGQPVTKQEVPILSTLENKKIVVLSNEGRDPVVTVNPNIEILGDYSNVVEKSNEEVVLCLEGNTFTRLELVGEDSTSKPLRVIKNITAKEHLQHPTSCLLRYMKGGSAGSKGVEFQINLLMVLLFNSLRKLKDWKLSTENNKAGKFDDAILELPESAFLIQAKNKEKTNSKITLNALLSTNPNNSFSLPKYFLSYQEVKNQFKGKNTIIICTNAGIDKTALEFLDTSRICTESVLYCADDNCSSHTFNLNILSRLKGKVEIYCQDKNIDQSVNTDNNLKDFLKRLQFYSNYPLGNNNKDKDTEILVSLLNCSGNFYGHISCSEIYAKLMKWFQQKHGIYLTETTANAMFLEIKSDQYWQKLDKYGVSFQGHLLNVQDKTQLYYVNAERGYLLQELIIHHSLRKYKSKILYASPDDGGIELQKRAIEAFELPCHTFLIFSWPEDGLEESVVAEICDKLRNTLNQYEKKKVILVAKSDKLVHQIGLNRSVCGIIDESVTFKDFCQVSQSKLLKEKVVFQGKEVSLEELLETQTDQDKLCPETLEKLVQGEQIKVGRALDEHIVGYYIDRSFKREIQKNEDEKEVGNKKIELILENKMYEVKDKVILIADEAGMGKSTILSHLAKTIKDKYPLVWVIRIELKDYTRILQKLKDKKIVDIIELLDSKDATKLSNQLEKVLFLTNKKVVIMIDGVDEISPDYTELVIGLLVQCQKGANFDKVFVTTRPNMIQELESKLQVKSFSLLPFTERHQIHFLTEYWAHNLELDSINKKKCEEYAKILLQTTLSCTTLYQQGEHHFASIPLLLTMLAEIFESSDRLEESMDWEGCKEYLNGSRLTPKLQEKNSITKIYKMFIEKKQIVFINKENPSGKTGAHKALVYQFETYLAYHRILALEEILDESECKLLSQYQQANRNMDAETVSKIGIVQKSENSFHFVHRTFAEYFVAESLLSELKLQMANQNENFQKFFFAEILLKPKFKVVRAFFDTFLKEIVHDLPSTIFDSYRFLRYDVDLKSNYQLIHSLVKDGCVEILRLLFKCIDFEVVADKAIPISRMKYGINKYTYANTLIVLDFLVQEGGLNIWDEMSKTPLVYAVRKGHLEMVKFLVERGANLNPINLIWKIGIDDVRLGNSQNYSMFYEAISTNYVNVVEYLLDSYLQHNEWYKMGSIIPYTFAYLGRLDLLKKSKEEGLNVNSAVENQETIIFGAARGERLDAIRYLIGQGADINARDGKGNTMLHITAMRSSLSTAELVIELGIKMDVKNSVGDPELHYAIHNLDMVNLLVKKNVDVNMKDERGNTAIQKAAARGMLETVKFLIAHESDVNIRSDSGETILHSAAGSGGLDTVKFLLTEFDVKVTDNDGNTPLHSAASMGQLETVKYLVERHADINIGNNKGHTALHIAVIYRRLEVVKYFAKLGAAVNTRDNNGRTPLHVAVLRGELDIVKSLVEVGADVDLRDRKDCTALHCFALNGNRDILDFLQNRDRENERHVMPSSMRSVGVNFIYDQTTLHFAAAGGDLDAIKYLAGLGVNLNITDDKGETPLHWAAKRGRLDAIKFLARRGSDVNRKDKNGLTAFHYAAMSGHRDLIEFLLDHGVGVINIGENSGLTALHYAAQEGHLNVVKHLVERNADVNIPDNKCRTPLHLTVLKWKTFSIDYGIYFYDMKSIVKFLIEHGADVNSRDSNGDTAAMIAKRTGKCQLLRYLNPQTV